MTVPGEWRAELRRIYDEQFDYDWARHIDDLNRRYEFRDRQRLATAAIGMPPVWFNGNIDKLEPNRWVLVISLNPSLAREGQYDHVRDREAWWQLWLTYNRDDYYATFFDSIVRVAASAIGENVTREQFPSFATDRMLFVEMCPYASLDFSIDEETLTELIETDHGFQIAESVANILLDLAKPALLLVNGTDAIRHVERGHVQALSWSRQRYPSVDPPMDGEKTKMLWHVSGWYGDCDTGLPAAGFPFLRKPSTHNSEKEQRDLGRRIRAFHHGGTEADLEVERPRVDTRRRGDRQETTRLDIIVGENVRRRLRKNHAVREVVHALCEAGISPHKMCAYFDRKPARVFASALGSINSDTFICEQERVAATVGRRFDRRRWFCDDEDLIRFGGDTYAFTNQWGLDSEETIERLLAAFPDSAISVRRSGAER